MSVGLYSLNCAPLYIWNHLGDGGMAVEVGGDKLAAESVSLLFWFCNRQVILEYTFSAVNGVS